MQVFIQQLINGLSVGAVYALIALGYSLVYGVLRLINFAHGDVYMVGAVVAFWAARWFGWSQSADDQVSPFIMIAMLAIAIGTCVAIGYSIERFAYRPLRRAPRLNSLITAIGVSFLLESFFQLEKVFGASPRGFPQSRLPISSIHIAGYEVRFEQVLILAGTAFFLVICRHIILRTRMGLGI